MGIKILIFGLSLLLASAGISQRIVVDSASTYKYLKPQLPDKTGSIQNEKTEEEPSFGDRAYSIGKGIINRLKARLNLESAVESIKDKKQKILGKPEDQAESADKDG